MDIPQEFLQESINSRVQDDNSDAIKRALTESGDEDNGELVYVQEEPNIPMPPIRRGGNTGPKGVLADYAEKQAYQRREMEIKNLKKEKHVITTRTAREDEEEEKRLQAKQQVELADIREKQRKEEDVFNSYSLTKKELLDEEDLEDDPFFAEYRQKRIQEIKSAKNPTFGYLRSISQSEFLDAIEKENPSVFVLIHLYQEYIPACRKLNYALQTLAIKYPFQKFLRIISTDALATFDDIGLPTLQIYQGGNLHTNLFRITDIIGNNFDVDDVETLLKKKGVIFSN